MQQVLSEPEFYGDLVYYFRKIVGKTEFSDQFKKIIVRDKRVDCSVDVMRRSECLVGGPVSVGGLTVLFGCAPIGRGSGSVVGPAWG